MSRGSHRLTSGKVRVLDGEDAGRQRPVGADPLVVGSLPESGLQLSDPKVSRRHLTLALAPNGFVVRDLGSRNGTWFEGSAVREVALPPGAILRVGDTHLLVAEDRDPEDVPASASTRFGELIGRSVAMRRAFTLLDQAARTDATVLLVGETGSGKDAAARSLHQASTRAHEPFEVLDCSAVPPTLLHSELFGHVQGAFTGATRDYAGVFERAGKGTVFIDEIGELHLELQPVLLRIFDRREITRVGATAPVACPFRFIAATWRDLPRAVAAREFREDLYYRLNVVQIPLPPLRERKEDLPLLCAELLRKLGMPEPGPLDGPGMARLQSHPWPGNVRELRNTLERALARSAPARTFRELLFELDEPLAEVDANASFQEQKRAAIERFERDFFTRLLEQHDGNVKKASRFSGIERSQLKRLLRKHGLL